MSLLAEVRGLVAQAASTYAGSPAEPVVAGLSSRLDEPLRVAIAGKVKAGKSTLLNALVGEALAPTDAGECTRIVTWYRNGITYRASIERRDGTTQPARFTRDGGSLEVLLDGTPVADVERLIVEWPTSALSDLTLIDTPGIGSLTADAEDRARAFLAPSEELHTPADAVLYLMRHLHSSDARFLETFHDDGAARAAPVNAIGVLSRADEVGGADPESMRAAARIAHRYRTDANVRRLCQTVVPVAGLLAEVGATLTEAEFRAVARVGTIPADEAAALLVSIDRFVGAPSSIGLAEQERAHLAGRFGLYGLRLAEALVRGGRADSARLLAVELRARSGVDELKRELATQFSGRRDVLKARSTLLALAELVRRHPGPGVDAVASDIERVAAGAHELAELRLLTVVRSGSLRLDEDEEAEVDRLVGRAAATPAERLGLAPDIDGEALRRAALVAHARWAERAESPLSSVAVAEAARVVQRTYEAVLAASST